MDRPNRTPAERQPVGRVLALDVWLRRRNEREVWRLATEARLALERGDLYEVHLLIGRAAVLAMRCGIGA